MKNSENTLELLVVLVGEREEEGEKEEEVSLVRSVLRVECSSADVFM